MNIVDPIRDKDDIQAMKEYLREWNERNYLLFLFGINSGLRVGDIQNQRAEDWEKETAQDDKESEKRSQRVHKGYATASLSVSKSHRKKQTT